MLTQICDYIHNYFLKKENGRVVYYQEEFVIAGGAIILPFMKEGQRFLIAGSDLNDGIYTYHAGQINNDDNDEAAYLNDETFRGEICPMQVPGEVLKIAAEIKEWLETNKRFLSSPYQSESFNGYSYSLKSGLAGDGGSENDPIWAAQFGARLEQYRRLYR